MKRKTLPHSALGRTLSRSWARLALGFCLVFNSVSIATVVAVARSGPAYEPADFEQPVRSGSSRTIPLAWHAPQVVHRVDGVHSNPITDSVTSTAMLPIALKGQPPAYPSTREIVATYPNCTLTRLFGFVLNQYGEPQGDIWVHYWADNYDGDWDKSSWEAIGDHNWDGTLDNRPRQVLWYACVVPEKKSWDCQSNTVEAPTSANCETGVQVYHINFTLNR